MAARARKLGCRGLGLLVLLTYPGSGPGAGVAAMVPALLHGTASAPAGICGCRGGHDCCDAPCCARAEPELPDCCLPEAVTSDCCAADPAPPPAGRLVFTTRCTCGDHDPPLAGVVAVDVHVPVATVAGLLPPVPTRMPVATLAVADGGRTDLPDPVPIALPFRSH